MSGSRRPDRSDRGFVGGDPWKPAATRGGGTVNRIQSLLLVRSSLWQRRTARHMLYGIAGLLLVIGFGVAGLVGHGWSVSDAFYMVMISVSTVGFGEVRPLDTFPERLHIIAVIALGTVAAAYAVGNLVAFITEGEIQQYLGHQRVWRQIEGLEGHVIVVGYGRMGRLLCAELLSAGVPFLLIERTGDQVAEFEELGILHLIGDATEEKLLHSAGIERAKALVSTIPSDAENVYITLTARQMAPKAQIIARAEQPSTQRKLLLAGANHVVLPAAIGASRIAALLTSPTAVEFTELVTQRSRLAIQLEEIAVSELGPMVGQSLRDADIGRKTGVMVVAIKRTDGQVEFPPTGHAPLAAGDVLVLLGRRENLDRFREEFRRGEASPARTTTDGVDHSEPPPVETAG